MKRADRLRWHEWLVIGVACGAVLGVAVSVIGTILSR